MHPKIRNLALGAVATGLGIALSIAVAAGPASASTTTTTIVKATTTTSHAYEVVAGTFRERASADRHLARIEKAGVTGLSVHRIGTTTIRYRVEERRLTHTEARAKVAKLHAEGFSAHYVLT